jgi:flagellar motor switch protein FliN/FliY
VLGIPLGFAHKLIDTVLGRELQNPEGGLSSGEEGTLLYILDRVGGDWMAAGGPRFVVRGFLADKEQIAAYLGREPAWKAAARIEGEELRADLSLWFSDPGASPSRPLSSEDIMGQAASWPVVLGISTGWSRVDADELSNLEEGDLIHLDAGSYPELKSGEACLTFGSGRWLRAGRWLDRRRIEVVAESRGEDQMDTKVKGGGEVAVELDQSIGRDTGLMEVVVRVEVGEVRMTVEKAAGLVPGRVIRLDRDVGAEVALKVGDKLIGRGELVEHEGSLAVEVLEVL